VLIDQLARAEELKGDFQKEEKSSPPQRYGECFCNHESRGVQRSG